MKPNVKLSLLAMGVALTITLGLFALVQSQPKMGKDFYEECVGGEKKRGTASCSGLGNIYSKRMSRCWGEHNVHCNLAVKIIPDLGNSLVHVYIQYKEQGGTGYGAAAVGYGYKMKSGLFIMECLRDKDNSFPNAAGFVSAVYGHDQPTRFTESYKFTAVSDTIKIPADIIAPNETFRAADGFVHCQFKLPLVFTFDNIFKGNFQLKEKKYSLVVAYAGELKNSSIGVSLHSGPHSGRAAIEDPFDWTKVTDLRDRGLPSLVQAHGVLMTLAYVTFMPVGTLIARFFKETWSDVIFFRKRLWFWIHSACLYTALISVISAYICMIIRGDWLPHHGTQLVHAAVGISSMILLVTQTTLPWILMRPKTPKIKKIYALAHSIIGYTCYATGILNIALLDVFIPGYVPCPITLLTFLWIGIHLSMFVLFTTLMFIKDHEISDISEKFRAFKRLPMIMETMDDAPGLLARYIFLGIFIGLSLFMASMHIYLIATKLD